MIRARFKSFWMSMMVAGLLWAWAGQAVAQTSEATNPPAYIREMVQAHVLTQEQVNTMLAKGYGWGEVRLATRLAQQMVANNAEGLTFEGALAQVMTARAEGNGFGQIAAANNLRISQVVGERKGGDTTPQGLAPQKGNTIRAHEVNGDEAITPDPPNPPAYIREMVQAQVVTQEQVNTMLASGYGWGEVRIAALMAQRMVANSNGTLTFDGALAQIVAARAESKDLGQIAAENNLKVGELVRNQKAGDATAAKEKKSGFLARVGRALGFGRSAGKAEKAGTMEKSQMSAKAAQGDKPERPVRAERAVRAERPEKPETPARVERPERPERVQRPERPERGPNR